MLEEQPPQIDDTIYEVHNLTQMTPQGGQTVLMYTEYLGDLGLLGDLRLPKVKFRGRGNVRIKIPKQLNPQGFADTGVEFVLDAQSVKEAYEKYPVALAAAGEELQKDADKQVAAAMLNTGLNGRMI